MKNFIKTQNILQDSRGRHGAAALYGDVKKLGEKKRRGHIACGDKNLRFVPIKVRG